MKKLAVLLFLITLNPSLVFAQSNFSSSTAELQTQIQDLLKQVQSLQQQVTALKVELGQQPETAAPAVPPELTRNLSRGSSGDDIRGLQEFLSQDKEIYPEGLVTGYFGPLTEAAVKRWQEKNGVESAGAIGPKTIARFNELRGPTATPAIPAQSIGLTGTTTVPAVPAQLATTTVVRPRSDSCAASYNYCVGPGECSANRYYWCRNSCYGSADACLGQTFVPPAISATPAQPATQTTQPATPAIPATSATATTTTSSPPPPVTATTTLLAPVVDYFKWGSNVNPNRHNLVALFKYQRASNSQSFNVYLKYPNNSVFTKYTYLIPAQDGVAVLGPDNTSLDGSVLDTSGQTSWQWRIGTQSADLFTNGTYKFYAAVTGTDGIEGPLSSVFTNNLYDAPNITNPINGATVTNVPFTISLSNTVAGLYYNYFIYNETGGLRWESGYTSQTSVSASPSSSIFPKGKTYQIYIDAYDNPYGAFSATKQKAAQSTFIYADVPPAVTVSPAPSIKTGTGIVGDSKTFNLGTGNIFYSVAGYGVSGYLYSSQFGTAPTASFANVTPSGTTACDPQGPQAGYQGITSICQFTSAANYTFSSAEDSVRIYDKSSPCYQGILLFKQNNLYGGIDLEDVDSSGALHYRYWYDESGGSNFSSVCATSYNAAPSRDRLNQLASVLDAIKSLLGELLKTLK